MDACLAQDPLSRVACETLVKNSAIIIAGEITSLAKIDYEQIVRTTVKKVGFEPEDGLDWQTCAVSVMITRQSPDIAQSLHMDGNHFEQLGAGDQGTMFGYATDECLEYMPLTLMLARKLTDRLIKVRNDSTLTWIKPDCKTQVTLEYDSKCTPIRAHTITISTQHRDPNKSGGVSLEQMRKDLMEHVIKPVIPTNLIDSRTVFQLQPSERFVIGGPQSDTGLTGRKIIMDSYGGWGAHGGGAFSGKDWSKVDRSAAYAARWIAKSLVHAGLCKRCLVQLTYAIGVGVPLAVQVDAFGTILKEGWTNYDLVQVIVHNFDLRPGAIAQELDLFKPMYEKTATIGHFGRDEFLWEQPKLLKEVAQKPS